MKRHVRTAEIGENARIKVRGNIVADMKDDGAEEVNRWIEVLASEGGPIDTNETRLRCRIVVVDDLC